MKNNKTIQTITAEQNEKLFSLKTKIGEKLNKFYSRNEIISDFIDICLEDEKIIEKVIDYKENKKKTRGQNVIHE